jgi:hypothetical protein
MLVIDTCSGTVLAAEHCVLLADGALNPAEWDALEAMSDGEVSSLARERGRQLLPDVQALDAVAALLSAQDWSSDQLNAVAEMVRATGRTIADLP